MVIRIIYKMIYDDKSELFHVAYINDVSAPPEKKHKRIIKRLREARGNRDGKIEILELSSFENISYSLEIV